jgi:hypothetical protein
MTTTRTHCHNTATCQTKLPRRFRCRLQRVCTRSYGMSCGGDVVVLDTKSGQWTYDDSHSLSQIQRYELYVYGFDNG